MVISAPKLIADLKHLGLFRGNSEY